MRYFWPPSPSRISESAGGCDAAACSAVIDLIDHAKIEFGGLAENLLQSRRVLQTGHLHQNAVGAFALDRRLDQAELVDAALDDLDRLIDGLANALDDRRVRWRKRDEAAILADIDASLARRAEYARQGLRQFAQLADRVLDIASRG